MIRGGVREWECSIWVHSGYWVRIWISGNSIFRAVRTTIGDIPYAEDINPKSEQRLGVGFINRSVIEFNRGYRVGIWILGIRVFNQSRRR